MDSKIEPRLDNHFYLKHIQLLANSFFHWTGKHLFDQEEITENTARMLYDAPFALLSHDVKNDPIFNYANKTAQNLFEMSWEQFTQLPSRLSAEPLVREERQRLLAEVSTNGFINNYSGVRITRSGKRFHVENVVVWNIVDENDQYCGQAAKIDHWRFI